MELTGEAKLLRIFLSESDRLRHTPLYEVIVREAHDAGIAGATAWRGMLSYGPTRRIRTSKVLDLSTDLPVIIEITDNADRIARFRPVLDRLFEESGSGGLVTVETVEVIRYVHGRKE